MALTRALPHSRLILIPTITFVFVAAACGGGPTGPSSVASSIHFSPGMYRLNVDIGPGRMLLCLGNPGTNTGFSIDVALSVDQNGTPRLKMPNESGPNSGTLTAEFSISGSSISGSARGWAIDGTLRRVTIQPPLESPEAVLSGVGHDNTASGDYSGGFTIQAPGGFPVSAPCTPLAWRLTPN